MGMSEEMRHYRSTTDPADLAEGAAHEWPEYRESVALNPSCSVALLARLSKDPDIQVRWAVAENANTQVGELVQLCEDDDSNVSDAAITAIVERRLVPDEVLAQVVDLLLRYEAHLEGEEREENPSPASALLGHLMWAPDVARDLALDRLALDAATRHRLVGMDLDEEDVGWWWDG